MKRIGIGATLAVATLVLAGCGGGGGDGAAGGAAPAATTLVAAGVPPPAPAPASAPAPARTGNAVSGKSLWTTPLSSAGQACNDCHGNPRDNVDDVQRGAAGWEVIARAVQTVPSMTTFAGRLTAQQRDDLSAYLATPSLW